MFEDYNENHPHEGTQKVTVKLGVVSGLSGATLGARIYEL